MSDSDRLDRLERRLEVLETLVRQLAARSIPVEPPSRSVAPTPPAEPARAESAPRPAAGAPPFTPGPSTPERPTAPSRLPRLSEQWLGQRGLLAVGVVFVVLAAGFLLKLSFDRGWVSPLARCVGGTIAGAGLGALGWRLHGKGFRVYGAALIGTGAAVAYLAVWAATELYGLLPAYPALIALALVSLGLSAVALAIDQQALGASAVLGALFAPLLVEAEPRSMNLLLAYLASVGGGLGVVSAARRWRVATALSILLSFLIPVGGGMEQASPFALYVYAVVAGAGWLYVGLSRGWFEGRFMAFTGGWALLFAASGRTDHQWPTVVGAAVLAAPVWWRAWMGRKVWPLAERGVSRGESFYFYLTPVLLHAALDRALPGSLTSHGGFSVAVVGLAYIVAGLWNGLASFRTVGVLAFCAATLVEWEHTLAVPILLAQALVWAATDHAGPRVDGRWYAIVLLGAALTRILEYADIRPFSEPAFSGPWALALWCVVAAAALLAGRLLREPDLSEPGGKIRFRPALWAVAGVLLLFGVTVEIPRAFVQGSLAPATQELAGGLGVSAWWIVCAAACFAVGFRRALRPLRIAGFVVAGLALGKVILVDLSRLDALYRVGSALILGVVSLAVAYAYHRTRLPEGG